jgi:hypothetical protein
VNAPQIQIDPSLIGGGLQRYNATGPLVEMPAANHSIWNNVQHPLRNTAGAGLTEAQRATYNARTTLLQWGYKPTP